MAAQFRPKMGMSLQNIVAGDQPMTAPGPFDTAPGMGMQPKKPGFFGEGGFGRLIAGAIGDGLLQNAGMQPVFAPMQQQRAAMQQEQANWGLRRKGDLEDYARKQEIEAKYRKPANPYRFQDNAGNLIELGEDGKPRTIYNDPTPKMNFISDGMGGGQWVAAPGQAQTMPSAQGGAPALPQGYTVRKTGGAGGNASGGFR